jgi:hypothetical protein
MQVGLPDGWPPSQATAAALIVARAKIHIRAAVGEASANGGGATSRAR